MLQLYIKQAITFTLLEGTPSLKESLFLDAGLIDFLLKMSRSPTFIYSR